MIFALFNVPHAGGQGFGRRLPLGRCTLFTVMQAGSFSNRFLKSADKLQRVEARCSEEEPQAQGLFFQGC